MFKRSDVDIMISGQAGCLGIIKKDKWVSNRDVAMMRFLFGFILLLWSALLATDGIYVGNGNAFLMSGRLYKEGQGTLAI